MLKWQRISGDLTTLFLTYISPCQVCCYSTWHGKHCRTRQCSLLLVRSYSARCSRVKWAKWTLLTSNMNGSNPMPNPDTLQPFTFSFCFSLDVQHLINPHQHAKQPPLKRMGSHDGHSVTWRVKHSSLSSLTPPLMQRLISLLTSTLLMQRNQI